LPEFLKSWHFGRILRFLMIDRAFCKQFNLGYTLRPPST
jgi:hypothetical protein